MPKSDPARMIIASRMSTMPCSAYLNEPPRPITKAITSSVAEAMMLGAPRRRSSRARR